jgi:gamma-glutamylcyclotransferase (GGCT)/AIG2-like uncharacterized protein YtfP
MEGHRFVLGAQGVATLKAEEGATVWGALWLVPAGELATLDRLAGVKEGRSERTTRRIISPAGPRAEAMVYVSALSGSADANAANHMAEVIEGALENRLPAIYIRELKTWVKAKH